MASPQSEAQFVVVDASDAGATELVPAIAGKAIRVLAFLLVAGGTVQVSLTSGEDYDEPLTGPMPMAANGSLAAPFNPVGWGETSPGESLRLVLSAGVAVTGTLVYTTV